jgi:hypothetical protein
MMIRSLVVPALIGGLVVAWTPAAGGPQGVVGSQWQAVPSTGLLPDTGHARPDTLRIRADSVREYQGLYESGFEVSWFHACDAEPGDDTWWVTLTNDALRQRDSLTRALTGHPRALLVRWRGTVSPKMPMGAGHMGRGSRYMLVSEVLAVRASDEKGCTAA